MIKDVSPSTNNDRKPAYLLADSQILFWNEPDNRFISSIRESLNIEKDRLTKVAYIGASNGDKPEFFDLFVSAMDAINIHDSKMIRSEFSRADRITLEEADLIVMAGGEVGAGWDIIQETGMHEIISKRYFDGGAVLVGVSAGAIQMGMGHLDEEREDSFLDTLKLIPYYLNVHEEQSDWADIRRTIKIKEEYARGFGIPAGGGMIYHPDATVEPLRKTLTEFHKSMQDKSDVTANILMPPTPDFEESAAIEAEA